MCLSQCPKQVVTEPTPVLIPTPTPTSGEQKSGEHTVNCSCATGERVRPWSLGVKGQQCIYENWIKWILMDETEAKHTAVIYLHSPDDVNITHTGWLAGNFSSASFSFIAFRCPPPPSLSLCLSLFLTIYRVSQVCPVLQALRVKRSLIELIF